MREGHLLLNRYKIMKLLGRGGMGSVYLAQDTYWGNMPVAVKTVNPDNMPKKSGYAFNRFKNEYDIMTRLNHPNLIRVKALEYERKEGRYYLIMEYFEGRTLHEILREIKVFSVFEAIRIMVPLLRAVNFIHSRGIIYRDIKPQNIIMRDIENIKLTDFGLSDFGNIDSRMIRGSVFFLAPEVLKGESSPCIDIFSLGVLFFNLLAGKPIIEEKTLSGCISILQDEKKYSRLLASCLENISLSGVRDIISGMAAYRVAERYKCCSEIITDINNLSSDSFEYESRFTKEAYIAECEFIDRRAEFNRLKETIYSQDIKKILTLVTGAPGSGKTRLLSEFMKFCVLNDIEYFECECCESISIPYYPILQIISQMLLKADSQLINKYGGFLINLLPYNDILIKYCFQQNADIKYSRETLHHILAGFLTEYSEKQEGNVLIIINDFQYSDENSIDIIGSLLERIKDENTGKLKIYISASEDRDKSMHSPVSRFRNDENSIRIKPFSSKNVGDYISSVFGKKFTDKTIISSIPVINLTVKGNPLFLKEYLRMLVNEGIIDRECSKWKVFKGLDLVNVPGDIRELISKRILSLPISGEERKLLFMLGLIKIELDISQIRCLSETFFTGDMAVFLDTTEKSGIIKSFKKEHGIYFIITHGIIRSAIIEFIPDKKELHGFIGERLEMVFKHRIKDFLDIIAHHYANSSKTEKAVSYLIKAGDKAKNSFDTEKALYLYDKALSLVEYPFSDEGIAIYLKKANALEFMGETDESYLINTKCLDSSLKAGDERLTAMSRKHLASNYRRYGDAEKAINELETALPFFEKQKDKNNMLEILCELGTNHHYKGDYRKAMEYYSRYKELALETENKKEYSNALGNIGNTYWSTGDYKRALDYYQRQKEIASEIGDKFSYSYAVGNLGSILYYTGEYDKAYEHFIQKKLICEELGDKRGFSHVLGNMGVFHYHRAEYDKSMELFAKQKEICTRIGDKRGLATSTGNIGNIFFQRGEYKNAMECYKSKRDLCVETGNKNGYSNAVGNMGSIYFTEGNYKKAMECYETQRDICSGLGDKSGYSYAVGNIGNIYEDLGNFASALDCYLIKKDICEQINDKKGLCNAESNMSAVYFELGDIENALLFLNDALDNAGKIGFKEEYGVLLNLKSEIMLFLKDYQNAELLNKEALKIQKDLFDAEHAFDAHILELRILAASNPVKAEKSYLNMLEKYNDEGQRANILYELWMLTKEKIYREKALKLYHQLHEKIPRHEYKKRIHRLEKGII